MQLALLAPLLIMQVGTAILIQLQRNKIDKIYSILHRRSSLMGMQEKMNSHLRAVEYLMAILLVMQLATVFILVIGVGK